MWSRSSWSQVFSALFFPMFPFNTPEKFQKIYDFLNIPGDIVRSLINWQVNTCEYLPLVEAEDLRRPVNIEHYFSLLLKKIMEVLSLLNFSTEEGAPRQEIF